MAPNSLLLFLYPILTQILDLWGYGTITEHKILQTDILTFVYYLLISSHFIVEFLRIYAGYHGNIEEAFPEMITFIFYCVLDMGILATLLGNSFPLEKNAIYISIAFEFVELCYG